MKDVKKRCDKCGLALEWQDRCDYCGKVISTEEIFGFYLTVRRTNPESEAVFHFQFCDYRHMTKWMQERKVTLFEGGISGITPYNWRKESRDKFAKS